MNAGNASSRDASSTGPEGSGDYVVREGDCISSIACDHGHLWETLWNDPANAALKQARKDPNVLLPGDRLTVMPLRLKRESRATDQRHRFRRKGGPAKFRLRLLEETQPPPPETPPEPDPVYQDRDVITEDPLVEPQPLEDRGVADAPYVLDIDGRLYEGQTDAEGFLEVSIPPDAKSGRVIFHPGTLAERVIDLELGELSPITEPIGLKQRLANLSFDCGDRDNAMTPGLEAALRAFQEKHGLEVTGEADAPTRQRLQALHGS